MHLIIWLFQSSLVLGVFDSNTDIGVWENLTSGTIGAIIGAVCTFAAAILTVRHESKMAAKRSKEMAEPEFFAPTHYDLAEATNIRMWSEDSSEPIIPNFGMCLKNTEKTPFSIISLTIDGKKYWPSMPLYLDRGSLVYLHVYLPAVPKESTLEVLAVDDNHYSFKIAFKDGMVSKIGRVDKNANNRNR